MEMERDLPTEDASMELDGGGDAQPSKSQLTLRSSWSQDTMTVSTDELPRSSELCCDAIHLDLLVEKGLIEYDMLDQQTEDEAGDYSRRLTSTSDLGGIADIVNEMRKEFIGKLSSNAKGLKRILIQSLRKVGQFFGIKIVS
ncbi:uncharacterized protein [Drosophila kikkawai]|uniref:Uncharacterized protein isoform X3 n=1 Tax=Drosophila kikkawai TaxID=30033 RepID=A0ABM4GGR2_DROKI